MRTLPSHDRRDLDPFGAELSLDDLVTMARVELEAARRCLLVSAALLDPAGPFGEARFSQPPSDELVFEPSPEKP